MYGIELFTSIDHAYSQEPDLAVISTPTSNHARDIIQASENGVDVFAEKPAAASLSEAKNIAAALKQNGTGFFISYQRRFHPLVSQLKKVIKKDMLGGIIAIEVNVNSYVPDWHPYEDFRELYACNKSLGGGVLRTEIHEIDLLLWLVGSPKAIKATGGCFGPYNLDVEDTAEVVLDYGDFFAKISLCFMNKSQKRDIKIEFEKGSINLDFISNKLEESNKETGEVSTYQELIENDEIFVIQAEYFLKIFERQDQSYLNSLLINSSLIDTSLNQIHT